MVIVPRAVREAIIYCSKFLDYRKTWSLPRDILCLLYGCVGFVLNWWYQVVLGRECILYTVTIFHADLYTYRATVYIPYVQYVTVASPNSELIRYCR